MKRACAAIALLTAVGLGLSACDDAPNPPKNLTTASPAEPTTGPTHPTTQELLTGPRHKISLGVIPFAITVPQSWEVTTEEGFAFLQGPTPAGEVKIQLAKRHNQLSKDDVEALIRAAHKDADAHPEAKKTVELRTMPNFRILDRQSVGTPISVPATGADGKQTIVQSTPYQWTLTLLLPNGETSQAYELNFYDLTLEQYTQDKLFLQSILDTLTNETAGG